MRKIISRPDPDTIPNLPLPVFLRSTGYNEAEPGWSEHESRTRKNFVQIFWCVQGTGEFLWEDRSVLLHPDEFIYRLPNEEHSHRSADGGIPWHYYWFTFDGPGAKDFMLSYGYPQEALPAGPCPAHLFRELETLLRRRTPYDLRHAVSVAAEILALGGGAGNRPRHDAAREFIALVNQKYADSDFSTESAAETLGMHRSTLTRAVHAALATSPGQYILQTRIQKALSMLLETANPVKEIAFACGFGKVDHFCALIRKTTGSTPAKYRVRASKDSL